VSDPALPRVALTFDAEHPDRPLCPPGNADRILDALSDADVRATFFIQGRWARSQPLAAKRIADEGHLVGHHSNYHAPMTLLSDEGFRQDLAEGEEAIKQATGSDPRPWFRCPFGSGNDDPRVLSALGQLGYRNVDWHVAVEDWEPWRTPEAIATDTVDGALAHGDGAVVLLHTWPGPTAEALPWVVDRLSDAGARFVTVEALEMLP
jgi:peptidoglycan/xylan/chitin deacetylase (PgdA/CDA1 family)